MSPFLIIIYLWIIAIPSTYSKKTRSRKRIPRCAPIQHGLDFEFDKFPRRYQLPFCQQYKKSCCKPSDTQRIFNAIKPLLQNDEISSKCRQMSIDIWCSACNPDIGTRRIIDMCIPYCNEWYNECRNEYYYLDITDKIKPCYQYATVCSPLYSFIANGTEFCKASGFDINYVYLNCFDGQKKDHYNVINQNIKMLNSKQIKQEQKDKKKKAKSKPKPSKKQQKLKSYNKQSPVPWLDKTIPDKPNKEDKMKKLKKKLKDNKQSHVPWLEETASNKPEKKSNKKKKKMSNSKQSKKEQKLQKLKKKLRDNKQSPVPWLEETER